MYGSCTTCGGTDPDPAQNPTSLKIDGITLLRDTELNIQKLTDGYGTITGYRIKFIEKADGTEWTAEDTDNPNVVRIDYTIKPTNYYTKKARYWYDESYEGTRFIVDEEQGTITFLKSGSLNVIVVSDNDTTIRDDVSIYWNTDEEWEEMTS